MKKRICLLLILIISSLCILTGCNKLELSSDKNISKLDSKVDYILLRNKKIYLSENFEEFILQFKGLGCDFKAEGSNVPGVIKIDEIDSDSHEFYDLSTKSSYAGYDTKVECYIESNYSPTEFSLMFTTESYNEGLYKNKKIDYWSIYPKEEITLYINGGKLTYGGDKEITKKNVVKVMGDNYKEEDSSIHTIEYVIEEFRYRFLLSSNDNTLISFTLEKKN